MKTTGKFLLSFDCEGKWGMVDCLQPRHRELFTTANLEWAYRRVTALLHRYGIEATFAFTSAFCLTPARFRQMRPEIEARTAGAQAWYGAAVATSEREQGEGWFAPACHDLVRAEGRHEIASHGFSHLPWHKPYATRAVLDAELALCRSIPEFSADAVRTFVFPRNQVAHPDLLVAHGFDAYRKARASSGRLANFASEFNLRSRSEVAERGSSALAEIPAGYFLNWRYGLRRGVPPALTVHRWKNIIRDAAQSGGVAHAWTHPENFLDGHDMFPMLEEIVRFAAEEREAGRIEVLTNSQYAAGGRRSDATVTAWPALPAREGRSSRNARWGAPADRQECDA